MENERSITCGCGFTTTGPANEETNRIFRDHTCSEESEYTTWYEAVFSFWGAVILLILAGAIVSIITGQKFW